MCSGSGSGPNSRLGNGILLSSEELPSFASLELLFLRFDLTFRQTLGKRLDLLGLNNLENLNTLNIIKKNIKNVITLESQD